MYERFTLMLGRVTALRIRETLKRQEGQTVTEYALVLAFVAILLAAVLVALAGQIQNFINVVGNDLALLPGF